MSHSYKPGANNVHVCPTYIYEGAGLAPSPLCSFL